MHNLVGRRSGRIDRRLALLICAATLLSGVWAAQSLLSRGSGSLSGSNLPPEPADIDQQVHRFCGECHAFPPPDSFPRSAWKGEVDRGFMLFRFNPRPIPTPLQDDVLRYYEQRAPEECPAPLIERADEPPPVAWQVHTVAAPEGSTLKPAFSFLDFVPLQPGQPPVILASDMGQGFVMSLDPHNERKGWTIHGRLHNPAVVIAVDLDADGVHDLVAADLGSFGGSNERCGRVVWLRGKAAGGYDEPVALLEQVGRVSDVRAADFTGDGRLDLMVASFGLVRVNVGSIYLLEGLPPQEDQPAFKVRTIDERHGAIHVPTIDLNRDGRPDFIALIAQEYEQVVAFLNEGEGNFRRETLYSAPHPAYGSSGIQLVDLDQDGHLDVLYTNGDSLDPPFLLKTFHTVQWLRNPGDETLNFEHRHLAFLQGASRALAGDVDHDGDMDVVALSLLPGKRFPQRADLNLDAAILLEQTSPGVFARHTLASQSCDHVACLLADLYGTGRTSLVLGSYFVQENGTAPALQIFTDVESSAALEP